MSVTLEKPLNQALTKTSRQVIVFSLLLLSIAVFYLSTIREGHGWGDDFSMYIHHANNLAHGIPYGSTGYIYNSDCPALGPKLYPPVFPVFLSPICYFFGLDLQAMKVGLVILLIAALAAIGATFCSTLSFVPLCVMVLLIGYSPFLWDFKDTINSDFLFLLLLYLCMWLIQRAYRMRDLGQSAAPYAVGIGIALYLCYGTRSIGIVLIPALVSYEILRFRRLTAVGTGAIACFITLTVLQSAVLPSNSGYLDQLKGFPAAIPVNVRLYASSFRTLIGDGYGKVPTALLLFTLAGMAALGFFERLRGVRSLLEIFPVFYLLLLVSWPGNQGPRMLLPVIPLFIFFVFHGLRKLGRSAPRAVRQGAALALLAVVSGSYVAAYAKADFGPIKEGVGTEEFTALCNYVKSNTSEEDIFIFRKPRAFALFTARKASVLICPEFDLIYHESRSDGELWNYVKRIGASYIVVGAVFEDDRLYVRPFVERHRKQLQEVYRNSDFTVYRLTT